MVTIVCLGLSCRGVREPPLRIGAVLFPGCELFRLAEAQGYFGNARLQMIDYRSPSDLTRDFRNGVVDAAAVTLDYLLEPGERARLHHVVLVMDFSEGADAVVAGPAVRDISALAGRRVGVTDDALGAVMLARALQAGKVQADGVVRVRLDVTEQEKAFAEGRVDALVTYEPIRSRLVSAGAHQIFSSAEIPGEIVDVLVTERSVADERAQAIGALVDGWFRARDALARDPGAAARILAARQGMTPPEFLSALSGLRFPTRAENRTLLAEAHPGLEPALAKLRAVLHETGAMRPGVPVAQVVFDGRFVLPGAGRP